MPELPIGLCTHTHAPLSSPLRAEPVQILAFLVECGKPTETCDEIVKRQRSRMNHCVPRTDSCVGRVGGKVGCHCH